MTAFLWILVPFTAALLFAVPGVFDTSMMSRLALYPLLAVSLLFAGRKGIGRTHLLIAMGIGLLPAISLLWSYSPVGGIPFAVRWLSFGMLVAGFSGTVSRYGTRPHLYGLAGAALATALLMALLGTDAITGNPNRAGMILATGFTASAALIRREALLSFIPPVIIITGVWLTGFITAFIACLAGAVILAASRKTRINAAPVLGVMILAQILMGFLPDLAGRIGPTLELRSRIWRQASVLFLEELPLGTGTGTARLFVYQKAEAELRELPGEETRVDFLHSEPITMITENGIPGLLLLCFILYWLSRKAASPELLALLASFWPVFATDLPIATPLGAIPAAVFLGMVPGFSSRKIHLPITPIAVLGALSVFWGYTVLVGYSALHGPPDSSRLEDACERIPWEERAFLAAGFAQLREGSVLSALESSRRFTELYPLYWRGWLLRATSMSAAGMPCASEWARAAVLMPENSTSSDRYIMVLNGIDPGSTDPDTAIMLAEVLLSPYGGRLAEALSSMTDDQLSVAAGKMLYLSDSFREDSLELSALCWHTALALEAMADNVTDTSILVGILQRLDLKESLPPDFRGKAQMYIDALSANNAELR